MPATYEIMREYVVLTLTGKVTDVELTDSQWRMFWDPDFDGRFPRLIDTTDVTEWAITPTTIRTLAREAARKGLQKAALVATSDISVGVASMYEIYALEVECEICRDTGGALKWLFL